MRSPGSLKDAQEVEYLEPCSNNQLKVQKRLINTWNISSCPSDATIY